MEIKAQFLAVVYNIFVLWLVSTLSLLLYCWRSTAAEFNLYCWFSTNKTRFQVGAILVIGLSILIVIVPDVSKLIKAFGFDAENSVVALGLGIGTILIAGINGNKPETVKPSGS